MGPNKMAGSPVLIVLRVCSERRLPVNRRRLRKPNQTQRRTDSSASTCWGSGRLAAWGPVGTATTTCGPSARWHGIWCTCSTGGLSTRPELFPPVGTVDQTLDWRDPSGSGIPAGVRGSGSEDGPAEVLRSKQGSQAVQPKRTSKGMVKETTKRTSQGLFSII